MSIISLPLQPQNDCDPYYLSNLYTYLVFEKVAKPDKHTKKTEGSYKNWEEQQETFKRMETGHFNCYNRPINPDDIAIEMPWIIDYFKDYLIFKIKPTSCCYDYFDEFRFSFFEFDVVKRIDTIEDLYKSFSDDNILVHIVSRLISFCSGNSDFKKWNKIWKTIKNAVPDVGNHIYFSDIVHIANKENGNFDAILSNLMERDEITIISKYDTNYNALLKKSFSLGIYKSILAYTLKKNKSGDSIELSDDSVELLKRHADIEPIAGLIKIFDSKFSKEFIRMKLAISKTEYCEDGHDFRQTKDFVVVRDVNEAKMYIARHFDVEFLELQKDIKNIYIKNGNIEYEFDLETDAP